MAMSPVLMLAVLAILGRVVSSAGKWSYHDISAWSTDFPKCSLKRQSPINIDTSTALKSSKLTAFKLSGYSSKQGSFNVVNNGHTVQLNVNNGQWSLGDGNLNGEYKLLQLHFHWGKTDSDGSEHTINAAAYPLEMHLVHMKASIASVGEAKNAGDGLAVLGVMFEIGEENKAYDELFKAFQAVKYKDQTVDVTHFPIRDLLPNNVEAYYRYMGSLTTPTCDEAVVWTVFMQPVKISAAQMAKFRTLQAGEPGSNAGVIAPNFRPVQKLNGRVVYRTHADSSASTIAQPAIAIVLSLFSLVFIVKP